MASQGARHGGRTALIEELAAQREVFLQACWAQRHWSTARLQTQDGRSLEVVSPGWLNRGPGPDFTEARLLLGGDELWGDVEVHVKEGEWWEHRHDSDPRYRRVVLHVVLVPGGRPALHAVTGEPLPVFAAAGFLPADVQEAMGDAATMLRRYEQLPGRCGLRAAAAGEEAVARVVAHAAEVRARAKADRLEPALASRNAEQVLFGTLFRYLGYRPQAALFAALAERYPLRALEPLLDLPMPDARRQVLARWFGCCGLLEGAPPSHDTALAAEFAALQAAWRGLDAEMLPAGVSRGGSRPWNSPERRMVGMFHHLYALGRGGLLKGWLALLQRLDRLRDEPGLRRAAVDALEAAFATPGDEPWQRFLAFALPPRRKPARLIGTDRVTVLIANAVLPFFLALARRQGDPELEKLLYRLYIVLPPEAPSRPIRFMERRLTALVPVRRTLRTQQGLLQIHQDFCLSFLEGCERCGFPDLIAPPVMQRP